MSAKPTYAIPTIGDTCVLPSLGPFTTKSNGQLTVAVRLGAAHLNERFFRYEESELAKIPREIRGLRSYNVRGLQKGSVGADEWHRVRSELVSIITGSVTWTCEDTLGNRLESTLDSTSGIWVPPYILHTYETLEDDTQIQVIANTLFWPEDPATHDVYSAADFKNLQEQYQTK